MYLIKLLFGLSKNVGKNPVTNKLKMPRGNKRQQNVNLT